MVIQNAIDDALLFVKEIFREDYSGHDYYHTLRVFQTATKIARAERVDVQTVQLAALLHDVDDRKLSPHTAHEKSRAAAFLRSHGLPEDKAAEICTIIREVSFRENGTAAPSTPEGRCVQDADRLDALGALGIARAFAYGGSRRRPMHDPDSPPAHDLSGEAYARHESTTINHFYEKLFRLPALMNTQTARAMAGARAEYMRAFIARFLAEWDGRA